MNLKDLSSYLQKYQQRRLHFAWAKCLKLANNIIDWSRGTRFIVWNLISFFPRSHSPNALTLVHTHLTHLRLNASAPRTCHTHNNSCCLLSYWSDNHMVNVTGQCLRWWLPIEFFCHVNHGHGANQYQSLNLSHTCTHRHPRMHTHTRLFALDVAWICRWEVLPLCQVTYDTYIFRLTFKLS